MKRFLIALILVLSLVICLPACNDSTVEENPAFEGYNQMLSAQFDNYTINISTTTNDGQVITEQYVVSTTNGVRSVEYVIERFNSFIVDGDSITVPGEYKTTTVGVYTASDSESSKFDIPTFNFSYKYLTNNEFSSDYSYSTRIKSLKGFMGLEINAKNASVAFAFSLGKAEYIEVTYDTESANTVVVSYTFE